MFCESINNRVNSELHHMIASTFFPIITISPYFTMSLFKCKSTLHLQFYPISSFVQKTHNQTS